jgi:lipoprotein-anchoring transpeptidase ErfK/SrfK
MLPAQDAPAVATSAPASAFSDKRQERVMAAQILLARMGHSPGVIDGYPGDNTNRALKAAGLSAGVDDGVVDTLRSRAGDAPLLKSYTITEADVSGCCTDPASGMEEMAKTGNVGYGSMREKMAEEFGMSEGFLAAMNPDASFTAGETILVANMARGSLGNVARIEVDNSANEVRAYGADGDVIASFPATVGSSEFPSPSGAMEVNAVAPEAAYYFDPSGREWGGDEELDIPAGPNNPVGGIWIDLSKEGYGIHGSPDPNLIGKTASHGCVRLTNWDAEWLSEAVEQGVTVEFV